MKRTLTLLLALLFLAPVLTLQAPLQASVGEEITITLSASKENITILNPGNQLTVTHNNQVKQLQLQPAQGAKHEATLLINSTGEYLLHAQATIAGTHTSAEHVLRVGVSEFAHLHMPEEFTEYTHSTQAIYAVHNPLGTQALLPSIRQENKYVYAAGYEHIVFEAIPLAFIPGHTVTHYNQVDKDSSLRFIHVLGSDELLILNQQAQTLRQHPLGLNTTRNGVHSIDLDLLPGRYFLVLQGTHTYVQAIEVTQPSTLEETIQLYTSTGEEVVATRAQASSDLGIQSTALALEFPHGPVDKLVIADGFEENMTLGIEPIPLSHAQQYTNTTVRDAFAINPGFSSEYTITRQATGSRLLKCTDYDFMSQTCFGDFEVVGQLTPGETYTFTFTPEDPLFIEDDWWDASFTRCRDITIPNIATSALTNFAAPLRIPISSEMQAGFEDIRIVSEPCGAGGEQLPHHTEYANASTVTVWTLLDTFPSSGRTISVYYGNSAASDSQDPEAVWANNGIVYLMDENGIDSSPNNRDVVSTSGTTADNTVLGMGRRFGQTGDEWSQAGMPYWTAAWSIRTHEVVFTTSNDIITRQSIFAEGGTTNGVMLFIDDGELIARWWAVGAGWQGVNLGAVIEENTAYHAAMIFNFPTEYAFVLNGELIATGTPPTSMPAHGGAGGIGYTGNAAKLYAPSSSFSGGHFNGSIHHFRTYDTAPSYDWINVSYDLILGSGASVSGEQDSAPVILGADLNATNINLGASVRINSTVSSILGSQAITQVNATVTRPDSTSETVPLTQEILEDLVTTQTNTQTRTITAVSDSIPIGEAGWVNLSDFATETITFNHNYQATPIMILTPATDNSVDNGLAPIIESINTTHAVVRLCEDGGQPACEPTSLEETLHYVVFDSALIGEYDWIDMGWVDGTTNEPNLPVTFTQPFSTTPYIFTTVQTRNAPSTGIAPVGKALSRSTTGATLTMCAHPGVGDICEGTIVETLGWVAVHPTLAEILLYQSGEESIGNSQWTSISFSPSVTNPIMMVSKQTENGAQDVEYPWARDVTSTGAQIRYCEQDGPQDCDTHNAEIMAWAVLPEGIVSANADPDVEANSSWFTYNNVNNAQGVRNVTRINISVEITGYDASGSVANTNTNPDLEIEVNTASGWVSVGTLGVTGTGTYQRTITEETTLALWRIPSQRNLRIRGVFLDASGADIDEIVFNNLQVTLEHNQATATWNADYIPTQEGNYTVTHISAQDVLNQSSTLVTNLELEVTSQPLTVAFILPTPENATFVSTPNITVAMSSAAQEAHYSFVDWQDSLLGWWRLEDTAWAAGSPIVDETGHTNITVTGSVTNTTGAFGQAASLSGGYLGTSDVTAFEEDFEEITMSAWVYFVGNPGFEYVLSRNTQNTATMQFGMLVRTPISGGAWGAYLDGSRVDLSTRSFNAGEWYHLTITYDGSQVRGYVNGALDSTAAFSGSLANVGDHFSIGRRSDNVAGTSSSGQFDGRIDEAIIFRRALDSVEVASLYDAAANQYNHTFTSLTDSNYTFTGYAVEAGVEQTETRTVEVDTTPPTLTIQSPINLTYITTNVTVQLQASDLNLESVWYNWNGTNTTYTGPVEVTFPETSITLFAWANDTSGNVASANVTFTVDTTVPDVDPPIIIINNPQADSYTTDLIEVDIDVFDASGVDTIWFEWNETNTTYTQPVNVTFSQGLITLTVWANDTVGNLGNANVTFFVDSQPPNVFFVAPTPSDGAITNDVNITINMSSSDVNDHYALLDWNTSLRGWWRFEETTIIDDSPQNITATAFGSAHVDGVYGLAREFSGTDRITLDSTISLAGDFTVAYWFNTSRATNWRIINNQAAFNNAFGYRNPSTMAFWSPGLDISLSESYVVGEWEHVAVTRRDGVLRVYRFGNEVGSASWSGSLAINQLAGTPSDSAWSEYEGQIDDIVVFDRALSQSEIQAIINATANQHEQSFINLDEGLYTYTGYAVDLLGNRASTETRTLNINTTALTLDILSPENLTYANQTLLVEIDTSTLNIDTVWFDWNGTNITYTQPVNVTFPEGSTMLTAWVNNTFGVVQSANVTFTIELPPPTIAFVTPTPENGTAQQEDSIFVNLSTSNILDHYSFVDFNQDVVLWMRMDNVTGSTVFDSSSYAHTATLQGGSSISSDGRFGDAYSGGASGTRMTIPYSPEFDLQDEFTISAWIRPNIGGSDYQVIANKQAGSFSNRNFWLTLWLDGQLTLRFSSTTGSTDCDARGGGDLRTGEWYHVVGLYDGSRCEVYVNTSLAAFSNTGAPPQGVGADLTIGMETGNNNRRFQGLIDEVLIFNRALSQEEINSLFDAQNNQYSNNYTSLADGLYEFVGYSVDAAGSQVQTLLREVLVDSTPPIVMLNSPANNTLFVTEEITLNWTVTDAFSSVMTCDVFINETLNYTTIVANNTPITLTQNYTQGSYSWSVACRDEADNIGISETRLFSTSLLGELNVFTEQDFNDTRFFVADNVTHSANWTIAGVPVSSGMCEISYYDGQHANMTYNATSTFWQHSRAYWLKGDVGYTVSCSGLLASNAVNIQSMVNVTSRYEITPLIDNDEYEVIITVQNYQNYTEDGIRVFTVFDEGIVVSSSIPVSNSSVHNQQVSYEWLLEPIEALDEEVLVLTVQASGQYRLSPVLAVSVNSASNVAYG